MRLLKTVKQFIGPVHKKEQVEEDEQLRVLRERQARLEYLLQQKRLWEERKEK